MEKTIVIYRSKYGYTARYAQWLAETLGAELCNAAKEKIPPLGEYGCVVFGGGLYTGSNKVTTLLARHFDEVKGRRVALFDCGLLDPASEVNLANARQARGKVLTPEIEAAMPVFYLRGGIDYARLGYVDAFLMKMKYRLATKKPEAERSNEERQIAATYGLKVDFADRTALALLIAYCRGE